MLKLKILKNNPLKLKISQACPSIEVDALLQQKVCCPSTEDIIITPDEGYDGIDQIVIQATPLEETTVMPMRRTQYITPSEEAVGLSSVEVKPVTNDIDENIIPSNIKKNVEILGVVGTLEEKLDPKLEEKRVSASASKEVAVTPSSEYDALSKVVVNKVTHEIDSDIIPINIREGVNILGVDGIYKAEPVLQDKIVDPSEKGSEVTYDEDYNGLGKVTVNPIKSSMISKLNANNIKKGIEILDIVGTYGATSQIKHVTPSQREQIITPDSGIEFLSQVTVQPVTSGIDEDIIPTNIKKGVNILGVEGTFDGDLTFQKKSVSANAEDDLIVTPDYGYDALNSVTVKRVTSNVDLDIRPENIKSGIEILGVTGTYAPDPSMEDKYIYPSTNEKTVYPDEGYGYFDKVTIAPVTSSIDSDIKASNIRENVTILGVEGTLEPVKGQEIFITPTKETQIITPDIEAGKNAITKATVNPVTSAVDNNIVNTNIKKGISILGVEGTYEGASTLQTKTVTPTNEIQQVIADSGYDALSSVTVEATPVEDITIEPNMVTKTYNRSDGKFINSVTVNQVTSEVDANIKPENIKQNMSILGVVGTYTGEEQNYFTAITSGSSGRPGILSAIVDVPSTIAITTGSNAFQYCTKLPKVPALDYSNVTSCGGMFSGCTSLVDTSNLINLVNATSLMNALTNCTSLVNAKLDNLNCTKLKELNGLFNGCTNLVSVDLSNFVTSVGTKAPSMFYNCSKLTTVILNNCNITKFYYGYRMFYGCKKLVNIDLSCFDSSSRTDLDVCEMFYNCSALQKIDIRKLNVSKITSSSNYNNMLYNVPKSCLIIVMDDACKTWFGSKFSAWTNVKTVAEYEAEQGA